MDFFPEARSDKKSNLKSISAGCLILQMQFRLDGVRATELFAF
jgi:hypothetical protein